jgi:hypothetical protein
MQRIVNNIENLSKRTFTNVCEIESIGAQNGTIIVCISTNTIYQYVVNGEAYPVDGSKVLNTKFRGNTRWLGIGGQYKYFQDSSILDIYSDLSTIDASIISIDASIDNLYSIKQDASSDGTYVQHDGSTGVPDPDLYFDGDEWTDPETLDKFKLYDDGSTKQWVQQEGYVQFYADSILVDTFSDSIVLSSTDSNYYLRSLSNSDVSVYITTAVTLSDPVAIEQAGAGTVTITSGAGVTLNGSVRTPGQYLSIMIMPVGSNSYTILGGV